MKYIKLLAGFISALFLATLVDNLGDLVFKPFLSWVGDETINIYVSVNAEYIDKIILRAMDDHINELTFFIYTGVNFSIVLLAYLIVAYLSERLLVMSERNLAESDSFLKRKNCHVLIIFLNIFLIAFCITVFYKVIIMDKVKEISSYAYSSIEIVRPNMSENEYLELKSQYLQVKNKDDFEKISETLDSYSDENHVLPEKPEL